MITKKNIMSIPIEKKEIIIGRLIVINFNFCFSNAPFKTYEKMWITLSMTCCII